MDSRKEILELQQRVTERAGGCCLPIGAGTKFALSATGQTTVERLDIRPLSGICAYDPSEFLLTAAAGTKLSEINAALVKHGQFLPFDPLFVEQGATIGGTVASGISGPGKLLYGGLRDFVMEVEMIDGLGNLVRGGGKVVKNAAGFDLPKLMVGSYGRLGILTEVTMKVLPSPAATVTTSVQFDHFHDCVKAIQTLIGLPLPLYALDIDSEKQLLARFAGPEDCLPKVAERVVKLLGTNCKIDSSDSGVWERQTQFQTGPDELLLRVTLRPDNVSDLATLVENVEGARLHSFSCGGSVAWVVVTNSQIANQLDEPLARAACSAVAIRGACSDLLLLGKREWLAPCRRIQDAIDPKQKYARFPEPAPSSPSATSV